MPWPRQLGWLLVCRNSYVSLGSMTPSGSLSRFDGPSEIVVELVVVLADLFGG